ncbi:hypothetical protein [Cognatishimia sp. MH4019]|uniref:hypothetical protein n=1 Tax=Cognatishimia sp. MH4019 TaxID=2854030 RepID=UPI001CD6C248|nr:hypothetical protein [Cognatishimia sp. MH4019]
MGNKVTKEQFDEAITMLGGGTAKSEVGLQFGSFARGLWNASIAIDDVAESHADEGRYSEAHSLSAVAEERRKIALEIAEFVAREEL